MLSTPKFEVCLESPLKRLSVRFVDSKRLSGNYSGNYYPMSFLSLSVFMCFLWSQKDVQVYEPKTISGECIEDASSIGIRLPGGVHLSYLDKSRAIR